MQQGELTSDDNLRLALATWIYRLHRAGVEPEDDAVRTRCDELDTAEEEEAAAAFVEEVSGRVGGTEPDDVLEVARALYGDRVAAELGEGDRPSRTSRIRKYQFGRSLPWLARIWERQADGRVAPSWLLVEQVTDEVRAMDPNPWNDVAEERTLPLEDFLVLWELDDCTSVHVR